MAGMTAGPTLEARLSDVENAFAELEWRLDPAPSWLQQVVGSQAGEPAFDDVLALGRAFREADRPAAGDPA